MAVPLSINGLSTTLKPVKQYDACGIYAVSVFNPSAALGYVQFFDAAKAADVTLGTTVPNWVVAVPTVATVTINPAVPVSFFKGCFIAATTTAGGSSAPATAFDVALVI